MRRTMKELILSIYVQCFESISVKGRDTEIAMIPFTGKAYGKYFSGEIIGTGIDTQKFDIKSGECSLSARYMLQGTDKYGKACRYVKSLTHTRFGAVCSNCWQRMFSHFPSPDLALNLGCLTVLILGISIPFLLLVCFFNIHPTSAVIAVILYGHTRQSSHIILKMLPKKLSNIFVFMQIK